MTALDFDPQFVQALRLLHSSNKDSVEQLRGLLDEAIKQKYGASKMLSNTLPKKYAMEEQVLSDQSSTSSKKSRSSNSSKHSKSSKTNSPITIRETTPDPLQSDDNLADILEDVACVICKGMDVGAKNRLVECVKCKSLYHQECHTPPILDSQVDANPVDWYCCNCVKSQPATKEKSSSRTGSETRSKDKRSSSSSSKHSDKHKSSSSSSSNQNANGSSSNPKMPNIHIVSANADKRLKDMMKKAKQDKRGRSSTNYKHSSSSKSYKNKSE